MSFPFVCFRSRVLKLFFRSSLSRICVGMSGLLEIVNLTLRGSMPILNGNYWEGRYQAKDTPWDKGEASPGLVDFLATHPELKRGTVCVPGCGFGPRANVMARAAAWHTNRSAFEFGMRCEKIDEAGRCFAFVPGRITGLIAFFPVISIENRHGQLAVFLIFAHSIFHPCAAKQRSSSIVSHGCLRTRGSVATPARFTPAHSASLPNLRRHHRGRPLRHDCFRTLGVWGYRTVVHLDDECRRICSRAVARG